LYLEVLTALMFVRNKSEDGSSNLYRNVGKQSNTVMYYCLFNLMCTSYISVNISSLFPVFNSREL
jgi:hypothetical protein